MVFEQNFNDIIKSLNQSRDKKKVYYIAVGGLSGCGKSFFCQNLSDFLNKNGLSTNTLEMDRYYLDKDKVYDGDYDSPNSLDLDQFYEDLSRLSNRENIEVPIYSYQKGARLGYEIFRSADVVIIDGIFSFLKQFRKLVNLTVYIKADTQVCYTRRLQRDQEVRQLKKEDITWRWNNFVMPAYKKYYSKFEKEADIVVMNM